MDEAGAPASTVRSTWSTRYTRSYVARGSVILRADALGRVGIPGRLHVRRLLPLSFPPRLFIDQVYLPRFHNAFGPIVKGTASRPGVFAIDEHRHHVTVFDVSQDPDRWASSLHRLFECIRGTLSRDGSRSAASPGDTRTAAHARELWAICAVSMRRSSAATGRPRASVRRRLWEDPNGTACVGATGRATGPGTAVGPLLRTDVAPPPDGTRLARGVPRVAPGRRCPAKRTNPPPRHCRRAQRLPATAAVCDCQRHRP